MTKISDKDVQKLIDSELEAIENVLGKLTIKDEPATEGKQFDYEGYKNDRINNLPLPVGVKAAPLENKIYLSTNYDHETNVPEDTNYTLTLTDESGDVICEQHEGTNSFMHVYKNHTRDVHVELSDVIKEHLITGDIFSNFPAPNNNIMWLGSGNYGYENFQPYYDYENFLELTQQYLADITNFYNAYIWVKAHPMAWLHTENGYYDRNDSNPSIWHDVSVSGDDRKVCHMFEYGAAVEPDRRSTYHDFDLDVYADTYEEGIIELAKQVFLKFSFDGSERDSKIDGYGNPEGRALLDEISARARDWHDHMDSEDETQEGSA